VQEAPPPQPPAQVQVQEAPQPPVQVQEAPPPQPRSWLEGIVNKVYTEEENAAIDRALSQERGACELIVKHCHINLRSKDMTTLRPGKWLNDNIIEFYMKTLSEREKMGNSKSYFFSTKFYTKMMRVGLAYDKPGCG